MSNTVIIDTPVMRCEPLKKTFFVYLIIFFFLGSVWLFLDFMSIATTHDHSKDFSQIFFLTKTFSFSLVAAGLVANLFSKRIFNPLLRNLNAEYEIHTPCSILISADFPYALLNACIIVILLLTVVTNKFCPFINLDEIGNSLIFLSNDCATLVKQTRAIMLGSGAGLSLAAILWAQNKEQANNVKILVNFHWTKTASTEYLFFAAMILLYLLSSIFFSVLLPML